MISVLLVDDQELVRAGLRTLLTIEEQIEVVGEAGDGHSAIRATRRERPDVVLMDLQMPAMSGTEATRAICTDPDLATTRVLILTTFDDDEDILAAVRAGAAGYLLKDTPSAELRRAVHAVAQGESLLSPQVTRKVMAHIAGTPAPSADQVDLSALTEREIEVLTRLAHGMTNSEIASDLYLSHATARTYVSRILTKLDARDRTELAILGHRAGLYER
ncbi:MAG TPA: response regulator transcription factor [Beutenbergiaceae bacterium]|nr:response regulator transcription factor [Beutenbergiaceae bacterium]